MDLVSNVLQSARVRSAIVLSDCYCEPWSIAVPDAAELGSVVDAGPEDLVAAFHVVERGVAIVDRASCSWRLAPGDVFIGFASMSHVIRGRTLDRPVTPMRELLEGRGDLGKRIVASEEVDARMLCGVFLLDRVAVTALGRWLPPVLHVQSERADCSTPALGLEVARLLRIESANLEPGTQFRISRLLELMLGDALRSALDRSLDGGASLAAAQDEVVWNAVALVTRDPGRAWSIEDLAAACAVSPSMLTERFGAAVGRAPIRYLTELRLNLASQLLEHSTATVEQIGHSVGYANQPAFSRAFKRLFATTPTAWRNARRRAAVAP